MINISPLMVFGVTATSMLAFSVLKFYRSYKDTNRVYLLKDDPNAQGKYLENKKKDSDIVMTVKEKLDLSWQFLYDITNKIMNHFSQEDQNLILELGRTLLANGARYEHVIEYGIRREYNSGKKVDSKKDGGGISQSSSQ